MKPEEIAYFRNIPENLNYYVKEVDIKSEEYDKIEINNTPIVGEKYEGEDGNCRLSSKTATCAILSGQRESYYPAGH